MYFLRALGEYMLPVGILAIFLTTSGDLSANPACSDRARVGGHRNPFH